MLDLIIIGAGPAGLSAAIYGKRAGLELVVLEKAYMGGGQILSADKVDNYPGLPGINGFDMGMKFQEHAEALGAGIREAKVEEITACDGFFRVRTTEEMLEARTVIYATGAAHSHLGVPGEEELAGKGVSYCATCDGAFFRKKTVAVVGGGDVALGDAVYLSALCEKVYLIHRRDTFRGADSLQKKVREAGNIEILYNSVVEEICGQDRVETIRVKHLQSGQQTQLSVSGIFVAVGTRPETKPLQGLAEMDEKGYVYAGEDCATGVPGLYVAGDIRNKPMRQVITAVADGANAAVCAAEYIRTGC